MVHELEQKGAHLKVLEPAISTDRPMGKMVLSVLGMVAEMEVGFIRDRQRTGIEAAKARGVYKGRPVTRVMLTSPPCEPRARGHRDRQDCRVQ